MIRKFGHGQYILSNFLRKNHIESVDLQLESSRIAQKKSNLSRMKRDAVLEAKLLREAIDEVELEKIDAQKQEEAQPISTI